MIWRTLLIPGMGHAYANQWRGWVYMPLWAGALGAFIYGAIDYPLKEQAYKSAPSGLEAAYADMNNSFLIRNIAFVSLIGVYTITILDILIFGKQYESNLHLKKSCNGGNE
jgi:hypothetical protein